MDKTLIAVLASLGITMGTAAHAQDLFVYPAKGQSQQQQLQDEQECAAWATNQTGYDPAYGAYAEAEAGKHKTKKNATIGVLGGAAGGAVLGEVIGDKAGKGAAAGAVAGGVLGGLQGQKSKNKEKQAVAAERYEYNRAVTACLEARGYSVS